MAPKHPLSSLVAPFARPDRSRALAEAFETFVPYLALIVAMTAAARRGHPWMTLALAIPAAAFLVRIFIIFHDCCHGSFFSSSRANRLMGYVTGLLTLTPFDKWQRSHARHHATVGDLDRRGVGDVWTLTLAEYRAATIPTRLFYRVFRNPFVMLGIGPAVLFVLGNRVAGRGATRRERFSVYFVNAAIVGVLAGAHITIGLSVLLLVQLPALLLAGAVGVWLFYVQHQFEGGYWARRPAWDSMKAALEGSSYYKLPKVLQWLTGSIGLHHIHHVQPRIPFYNLQRCQDAVPAFQAVPPLTLRRSLDSLRLRLVDETGSRMVGWAAAREGPSVPRR
jgi:omega-6 fatty acid desaturase (delta-12 desaturase)